MKFLTVRKHISSSKAEQVAFHTNCVFYTGKRPEETTEQATERVLRAKLVCFFTLQSDLPEMQSLWEPQSLHRLS